VGCSGQEIGFGVNCSVRGESGLFIQSIHEKLDNRKMNQSYVGSQQLGESVPLRRWRQSRRKLTISSALSDDEVEIMSRRLFRKPLPVSVQERNRGSSKRRLLMLSLPRVAIRILSVESSFLRQADA